MSEPITLEEVLKAVEEIKEQAHDFEMAHGAEDDLHARVLQTIAEGNMNRLEDAEALAEAALRTHEITFPRYCA